MDYSWVDKNLIKPQTQKFSEKQVYDIVKNYRLSPDQIIDKLGLESENIVWSMILDKKLKCATDWIVTINE